MARFSFSRVPTVSAHRSSFDLSRKIPLTMNVGTLYPVGKPYEVYPGDTFKIRTKFVERVSSSFLKPVMDDLYIEFYTFFVPHRIVYHGVPYGKANTLQELNYNFEGVMGENKVNAWAPSFSPEMPFFGSFTCSSGTVADYLEFPLGSNPSGLQAIPFRGFAMIYDKWYRDQNNVDPMYIATFYRNANPVVNEPAPNNNAWSSTNYTGKLPKVTKAPDYFTRCLPSPQKGNAVDFLAGAAILPVRALEDDVVSMPQWAIRFLPADGTAPSLSNSIGLLGQRYDGSNFVGVQAGADNMDLTSGVDWSPSNLGADLSAAGLSINDFRVAMALQRMLEKDAIGGTRYKEILQAHWGVKSPDARLEDPELIGGFVQSLNIQQVPQTAPATGSKVGDLGAYSWTSGSGYITKGFAEHGYLFTCACIKQKHSYSQGIPKQYTRIVRTDFYDPVFKNLGALPVYKEQLYASGITKTKDQVFGYQEAWDELRQEYNGAVGQMRPQASTSFGIYNFVDNYANAPTLNQSFVEETPDYVDRTLAVSASTADQFLVDVEFETVAYRELPVYSNPSKVGVV